MAVNLILGPVLDIIGKGIDKIFPDANQKELLKAQAASELLKMDWSNVEKEFQDRADARSLAKVDSAGGNWFTAILSATVRPAWGYWSMAIVTVMVLGKTIRLLEPTPDVMDLVKYIVTTVIWFFFGGRTTEKVVDMITSRRKP